MASADYGNPLGCSVAYVARIFPQLSEAQAAEQLKQHLAAQALPKQPGGYVYDPGMPTLITPAMLLGAFHGYSGGGIVLASCYPSSAQPILDLGFVKLADFTSRYRGHAPMAIYGFGPNVKPAGKETP